MSRNVFATVIVSPVRQLEALFEMLLLTLLLLMVVLVVLFKSICSTLGRRRAFLLLAYFSAFMR